MAGKPVTINVRGLKRLENQFRKLSRAIQMKIIRQGLKAAGEPMLQRAKELVAVDTGNLKKQLKLKQAPKNKYNIAGIKIGTSEQIIKDPATGEKTKINRAAHAHLVEFGTGPRFHKDGTPTGQMPALPFLRPAYHEQEANSIARFGAVVGPAIERAAS